MSFLDELFPASQIDRSLQHIMETYEAIERVHNGSLRAMGQGHTIAPSIKSSAGVMLSTDASSSTDNRSKPNRKRRK